MTAADLAAERLIPRDVRVLAYREAALSQLDHDPTAYWVLALARAESDWKRWSGADREGGGKGMFQITPSPGMSFDPYDIASSAAWVQRFLRREGVLTNPVGALSVYRRGRTGAANPATGYYNAIRGYLTWASAIPTLWSPPQREVSRLAPFVRTAVRVRTGEPVQLPVAPALRYLAGAIERAGWPRPEGPRPAARQVAANGVRGSHLAGLALDIPVPSKRTEDGQVLANWLVSSGVLGHHYLTFHGSEAVGTQRGTRVSMRDTITGDGTLDHNDHIHVEWPASAYNMPTDEMAARLARVAPVPLGPRRTA